MGLNKILAGFTKTLQQLERLVQDNSANISSNNAAIFKLEDSNDKLLQEKRQALLVIDNLNNLLGDK